MDEEKKEVIVDVFIGSLKEYEKLKKHRCEIVDTGTQSKHIAFSRADTGFPWIPMNNEFILDNDIIGVIRYFSLCDGGRGIPVRKKVKLPK